MRSGYVRVVSAGTARYAGIYGGSWPRDAVVFSNVTSATTYSLRFDSIEVYPSNGPDNRWLGFTLRCLSTALEG